MRAHWLTLICGTGLVAVLGLAGGPAVAASSKAKSAEIQELSSQQRTRTVVVRRRAPSRITVRPRSYLDPGTEPNPGEHEFTDYAVPPTYTASNVILGTGAYRNRWPLPGPFDLPSKRNPWLAW